MPRYLSAILIGVCCLCVGLWAQSVANSRVTGVVTDSTGASIAGAQVQITQTGTGLVRTAETNGDGSYTIPDLPTGSYALQVRKDGFNTYVQSGIVLEVGSNPTLDVTLQVGAITQEVTVTADAALVETHSNSIGQVVTQQEVLDIPLNARDPMQLLTLTPAAVVGGGAFNSSLNFPNPYTVAFAGTNPGAGTYLLDGGNDNDQATADSFPLPFPDALQEFKVDTSAVPAEYGMHSSATVNAITKSGTNDFHGDAFEFVRNALFNARQFYSPIRDPLKRNQFGGVIGGPIRRDKLFFFAAIQDTIVRDQSNNVAVLPTPAELAGNFTVAASSACRTSPLTSLKGSAFGGGLTTAPSNFSQPALKLADLLPVPTDTACGNYAYQVKVQTNDQQVIGKVDYHLNDKHSLFARYYFTNYSQPADTTNFQTLNVIPQHDGYQSVTLGETYLISSTVVNSFHANLNRANNRKDIPPGVVAPNQLGIGGNYYSPYAGYISATITGAFMVKGAIGVPVFFHDTDFQFADDVEMTRGSHQLAFGGEWVHFNTNSTSPIYVNGVFTFSGQTTGLPIADFLMGDLSQFQKGNEVYNNNRKNFFAAYAQDSWQVNRKLTANYGLRWEPFIPYHQAGGEGYFFSLANFQSGIHSKVFPNAPAGLEYPGQDFSGYGNSYLGNMTHFEPRIGLTYDPRGKGREVIRASYGTFYDFVGFMIDQNIRQSTPWADSVILQGVNFTNPFASYKYNGITGVDPYPIQPSTSLVYPNAGAYETYSELHVKAPMLQQWNLSAEKQFGQTWSVTLSYIGNHGTHNAVDGEENQGIYIPGNCTAGGTFPGTSLPDGLTTSGPCSTSGNAQSRRRLTLLNSGQGPFFSSIADVQDNGVENYNGGILTVQKRMSNSVSLTGNYTYGHCTDNGEPSATFTASGWRNDISRERGNCTWDHRHQLTVTALIQSPKFHSGLMEAILGNWQVSPIITYLSGDWLTVTTGADNALVGITTGQRPNAVAGQSVYVPTTILPATITNGTVTSGTLGVRYFNSAAFAAPTAPAGFTGNLINNGSGPVLVGPVGNLGRGTLLGPSNHDVDLALTRQIKINERHEIDLRFEAFNVFNIVRYYDPTVTMSSSTFGESIAPTTAPTPGYSTPQDPRIMQFALKYIF